MSPPLLAVKGLTKRYGSLLVTDDVYLDIATGEAHALIGPNGAGKTTLIHQLSGLVRSNGGRILLDGQDITPLDLPSRVKRGIARSFQITSVLPGFTVLDNVATAVQARSGSSFRFWRPAASERALNDAAMEAIRCISSDDEDCLATGFKVKVEPIRACRVESL